MKIRLFVLLLAVSFDVCRAATFVWIGGGTDANWSTAANWSGGVAPANDGSAAIVLAGTTQLSPNLDAAWDIGSLSFSNNAGAFVLGGSALNIRAGGVTNNSANGQIINSALTVFTNQTWSAVAGNLTFNGDINNVTNLLTISGSFNSSISGSLGGTGGLTKSGTGTLILGGSNTYSGITTVSAGVINLQNSLALGSAGAVVASGAALQLQGGLSVGNALTLSGTGIGASGALRNLAGNNTWAGVITLAAASSIGCDAGTFTWGAGGIVNSTFLTTFTGAGNIQSAGPIGGGTGGLTKSGTGTLTLSGSNTYSGATTVSAGVLNIQNSSALGTGAAGATVSGGAVLQLQGGVSVVGETLSLNGSGVNGGGALESVSGSNFWNGAITLAAAATLNADAGTLNLGANIINANHAITFTNAGTILLNGVLGNGSGAFTKNGTGLLVLGGANTYTGATTVSAGTLQFGAAGSLSSATAVTVSAGGTLDLNGFNESILSLAGAGSVTLGSGTLTVNNTAATTFSGVMSGAGSLVKAGTGTLTLSGANTYSGGTTINAGAISIAADTGLGDISGTLTLNSGTLTTSATLTSTRAITLGASGGIFSPGATTLTLSGVINGPGTLTKLGTGTLSLSGSNSYLGGTTNSAGIISINSGTSLGDPGGPLTFSASATVATTASFSSARNFLLAAGTATYSTGTGLTNTLTGVLSGAGAFTKAGTGTLVLNGNNTYSGITTVSAGVLNIQNSSALGTGAAGATVSGGAVLQLQGGVSVVGETLSLNGSGVNGGGALESVSGSNFWNGAITLAAAATLNADAGTLNLAANIANSTYLATFTNNGTILLNGVLGGGTGGLTKTGTGLLQLNGANTYTGATTVSAGTLQFGATGSLSSTTAVTVNAGGTLDLNGFNESILSLAGAGSVTLGSGTLTLNNTAATTFSGVTSGAGSLVKAGTGTLTLSGANTYSGGTTINAGAISIAADTSLGDISGALTLNSGTLTTSATLTSTRAITLGASGGIFNPGATTLTLSGVINGPGALSKIGTGTLSLSGSNSYLGGTTNSAGIISINSGTSLGDPGGPLTFSANATVATTASFSSARNFLLAAGTATYSTGTGLTNTLTGVLSGAGAFTKAGTGTLVLNGNNTYSGITTVSAGVINLQNSLALGSAGAVVASGAALQLQGGLSVGNALTLSGTGIGASGALRNLAGNNTWAGVITLAAASSIGCDAGTFTWGAGGIVNSTFLTTFTGAGNIQSAGPIGGGTGGLTKSGTGTLTLSGSNTYSGATTVSAGVLNIQNSSALGTGAAGATVSGGAVLQLQGGVSVVGETLSLNGSGVNGGGALESVSGSNFWNGAITLAAAATLNADAGTLNLGANIINANHAITFTNAGTILLNGVLGNGSGAFTKNGTGLLVLGGANTYTGATTVSAGTLQFGAAGSLSSATAVTVSAGGTLDLNGFNESILSLAGAGSVTLGSGTLTVNNTAATTFSGVMSGAGSLVKAGTGTLTLSGANTYSGGTTINAGAISIAADTGLGDISGTLTLNSGTLTTSATLTSTRAITLGASGGIFSPGATTLTLSGVINGPGTLTKLGTGTLSLSGSNSYLGGTTNSAGIISINSGTSLGDPGGPLTFSASATVATTASFSSARNFLLAAGTATYSTGTGLTNTLTGVLSGAGAFTKAGTGTLVLNGNNTYSNTTTISAGTLQLGGNERLSDLTDVKITSTTATFDLNGFTETIGSLASSAAGQVTLGSGSLTAGGNNNSTTLSAVISGTGSFTKAGTGTMTLSGANTYTGTTTISAGTLQISTNERIADTSPVVVNNGAVFNLNNFNETIGSLAGAGSVTLGSGTLTTGNSSNVVFSGSISGTGGFTKVGTGTQIFSGTDSYSGATTVSAGNLQVNGSSPNSAVTMGSGATLSGSGTVGTVAGASGSTNAPGSIGPGTLTSGAQTWAAGGNYVWEINNPAGSAGGSSGWDWMNISGTLTINATASSPFTIKLVSLTAGNANGLVANFDNTATYFWRIASASGGISGFNPSAFNLDTSSFQNPLGAGTFVLSQSGNDLDLIFTTAAPATIKDVQSGTLTSSGNGTNTATLSVPVNPTSAFLIFNTRHDSSVPGGSMLRGRLASSNTVEFVRATTETSTMDIQWYVVEYSAGVRVQRGEVNQTNTVIDVALSPLSATNQAFVTWSKTPDPAETSFTDSDPVVGQITTVSNLQFRVNSSPSSVPIISWQVVEFQNPASLNVQQGSVTNLTGTNLTATATLPTPVNPLSTFILTGYRTSGSGTSIGARMLRAQLTGPSTLTFDRSISGGPDDISEIFWQAVQLNDGSVVQSGSMNLTTDVAETNVTLTSLNTNLAVAFASVQPAGGQNTGRSPSTDSVPGVGSLTLALTSATQLTLDRNNTSDQCDVGWFVVGFGSGSLLTPATGGAAISADTTAQTYTSLTGPIYAEAQNGNVGAGTLILNPPAGFVFDTNTPQPTVLITRIAGSGADALNINGVTSGTSVPMSAVTPTALTFTVTSPSSGGVNCSLTWQDLRLQPSAGTPLASGTLTSSGTAFVQGVTTNATSWGLLTEVAGAAAQLGFQTVPSSTGIAGIDFAQQPVIQVQDQFGNLRSADNSSEISASLNQGSGTLLGTLTAIAAKGVATFTNLSYQVAETITIDFNSGALAGVTSGGISINAAAATQLAFSMQPGTATVGSIFGTQPVLITQDAYGNNSVSGLPSSLPVTLALTSGSGILQGTTNLDIGTAAGDGTVTFVDLEIDSAGNKQLTASASGLASAVSSSCSVAQASQTITFSSLSNQTYGGAPFTVSASASSGLPVTFSIVSGPATVSSNLVSISGAGTVTVSAGQPGDIDYLAATPVNQSFTIAPAMLTVTADNQGRIYGAANPPLTASYSGFVNGDNSSALSGSPSLSTGANTNSPVGIYAITVGAGSLSAANYSFSFVNGTLTVGQATVTVRADNQSRLYGVTNPPLTASYSGFVNNDNASVLSGSAALSTSANTNSPVGSYDIVAALGSLSATNYAFAFTNGTLTVGKALLTVMANDTNRVYGAANPTLTARYSGFVEGDDQSVLSGSAALSTSANTNSPVGNYDIVAALGSLSATNYAFAFTNGTLTVTAAALTVSADDTNRVYGAVNPNFTGTVTGQQNGDDITATFVTGADTNSPVGNYSITAVLSDPGNKLGNYTVTTNTGSLAVSQASTSGALNSSVNPALPNVNVTFTMTVSAVAPGAGIPTGTVNFVVNGSVARSVVLSGGLATFATTTLPHGSYAVAAEYAGDLNFTGTTNSLAQNQVINTPPVASNVTVYRNPVLSLKILLSTLLASASDADGDLLSITVNPTSVNGATITVSGGWVFYTPPAGFTNADSFNYTVTDGYGGTAVGAVTVAIQADNTPSQNLSLTPLGGNSFLINGNGIPGYTYRLQYSDTTSPYIWQDLVSVTADPTGNFEYTDTSGSATRFYRTVYP